MSSAKIKVLKLALMLLAAVSVLLIAFLINLACSVQLITIGTGPDGGTYSAIANAYADMLDRKGYRVQFVKFDNTDEIAASVNNANSPIDVGFTALDLDSHKLANIVSLGEIQIQPIFVFSRASTYPKGVHSFSDLRGMNLVLPPAKSVTGRAVLEIFRKFGIDQNNTRITFLPLKEAVDALEEGRFDTGLFILSADNPYVIELANSRELTITALSNIDAIVKQFPFLRRTTLPAGIYDLDGNVPPRDIELLAANISIVAKKTLPPASVYAMLEVMSEKHRHSTYVSTPGQFPTYLGSDLVVHPLVPDFYRSGTPWIFSNLPPALANAVNKYIVAFLALWFLVGLRQRMEEARSLQSLLVESCFRFALRRVQRSLDRNLPLNETDLWMIEKMSDWVQRAESDRSFKIQLEKIVTHPIYLTSLHNEK